MAHHRRTAERRRRGGFAALAAAALVPAFAAVPTAPEADAATALFAEGATRQTGEAQSAFNGAFCEQNECRSLGRGTVTRLLTSRQIQAGVDSTPGDLILGGYSVGAAGMYDRLREWERDPSLAPDPDRIVLIVTFGNPENKFGGQNRNNTGVGLPEFQPYDHLDVTAQYDGVADNPTRFGYYSFINQFFYSRHFEYFEDIDINDPDNLVYQEGTTTYMLIPAKTLPMLQWIEPFVTPERMAELDARYRPLVERDYDRPAYVPQGEGADWGNGNPPPSLSGGTQIQGVVEAANSSDSESDAATAGRSGAASLSDDSGGTDSDSLDADGLDTDGVTDDSADGDSTESELESALDDAESTAEAEESESAETGSGDAGTAEGDTDTDSDQETGAADSDASPAADAA